MGSQSVWRWGSLRCGQRGSLPRERRETLCPLEAGRDQVGPVGPCEVEGMSAADRCTESLGGMETPGALVVARVPSVIVPVCAVKGVSETPCARATPCVKETPCVDETPCVSGVVASVPKCVLPSTPCVEEAPRLNENPCVEGMTCVSETPCASGRPCVDEAPCEWNHVCEGNGMRE